jgi:hypothetical protein
MVLSSSYSHARDNHPSNLHPVRGTSIKGTRYKYRYRYRYEVRTRYRYEVHVQGTSIQVQVQVRGTGTCTGTRYCTVLLIIQISNFK